MYLAPIPELAPSVLDFRWVAGGSIYENAHVTSQSLGYLTQIRPLVHLDPDLAGVAASHSLPCRRDGHCPYGVAECKLSVVGSSSSRAAPCRQETIQAEAFRTARSCLKVALVRTIRIASARLGTREYGLSRPAGTNATSEGLAKNKINLRA